jgi:hydrogenase/urease accessory protein HupE
MVLRLRTTLVRAVMLVAAMWLPGAPRAVAHPLSFTDVTLTLRADGGFEADLIYDLDALALGAPIDTDDSELAAALEGMSAEEFETRLARLRRLFERRVRVRFDGDPAPFTVAFPDHGTARATEAEIPTVLGLTARLAGTIPEGAATVGFFASRAFGEVHLTIRDPVRGIEARQVLEAGARSDPLDLTVPPAPPGRADVAARYARLGFIHIVPEGLDHILFVLGLFLLGARLRPLVWQVTAFTLAHAATLTLAALGVVALSPRLVEPLIALSIVYVAVENILTDRMTRWRPPVVFGFGLLHGLGFAGVLGELGLPDQERLVALVSFNAGIELGQLAVIAGAALACGWFRSAPWYRARIVVPASAGIALVGLVWAVERVL